MKINARPSKLATALLELKGVPLSFEHYRPFELVYDLDPELMVLKAGRQVGKSVSQGGRLVAKSAVRTHFNSLYIAPLQIQSRRFSGMYVDPLIRSPLIKKHFTNTNTTRNVFEKSFSNGSKIYISYAENEHDADRIRGIMADQLLIDEVQDVSWDALVPIYEILSASEFGFKVLSGTSKSTANTLEQAWMTTNRMEWVCKCEYCGRWVIPDNYDTCIIICSKDVGPVCDRCLKPLDMAKGRWVAATENKNKIGFHLPQFIMTSNTKQSKWLRIREKVDQALNGGLYSPAKLANESFGLATDLAGKAISVKEAMSCCNPEWKSYAYKHPKACQLTHRILGIDWSVTGSDKSYTVMSVIGVDHQGKIYNLYSEKMQGIHILTQVERAAQIFREWKCCMIGADRGVGVLQGQLLQKELGFDKVILINYVMAKLKLRWDKQGLFLAADRTQAIDNVLMKVRLGRERFETPCYELHETHWKDALNVFEEETMSGNRVFRHHPDEPDDWLHSVVFANIAYQFMTGDYEFLQ